MADDSIANVFPPPVETVSVPWRHPEGNGKRSEPFWERALLESVSGRGTQRRLEMKGHYLLASAAAALLLAGAASAQNEMKKGEAPAPAPAAQQKAPAEKMAPSQKSAPALKAERKTPETTGQAPTKEPEAGKMNKETHVKGDEMKKGADKDRSAEPHRQNSTEQFKAKSDDSATKKSGEAATKKSDESATKERSSTTGQGAAGAARLSTEQRAKITSIIRSHKVAPVHLNVTVRVGTRVPDSVHFYPLPVEVVEVYPEWRGYDYILVGDEIVVLDPRTHEIVAILEA
jgi:hypothetical protein